MLSKPSLELPPRIRRSAGGCTNCRARHIQCDKAVPACSQCTKKRFECPGYQPKHLRWRTVIAQKPSRTRTETQRRDKNPLKPSGTRKALRICHESRDHCDVAETTTEHSSGRRGKQPGLRPQTQMAPYRIPASLSTFYLNNTEDCRRQYFHDHYFGDMAGIISMWKGSINPFGQNLKQYMSRSRTLDLTIRAMAAFHMAHGKLNSHALSYAWHYRTLAMSTLRCDLNQQVDSTDAFISTLFLGMSESWFNLDNCGSVHLYAAKQLLVDLVHTGRRIPPFLTNCLCFLEMLAAFVSDHNGLILSSPHIYETLRIEDKQLEIDEERKDQFTSSFDPLLGNWADLMPHISQAGALARRIRNGECSKEVEGLLEITETNLLEWGSAHGFRGFSSHPICHVRPILYDDATENLDAHVMYNVENGSDSLGEAYRLAGLLVVYGHSPRLLEKRTSLLVDIDSAPKYLPQLASAIVALLRGIHMQSGLWNVSLIPVLSAAQFVIEPSERDFLRSAVCMLVDRVRLPTVPRIGALLEEVWSRRDSGVQVWWMNVLEESQEAMLVN